MYDIDQDFYFAFPSAEYNSKRLPPFVSLDLRFDKLFHFKSGSLKPMQTSSMCTEEKILNSQAITTIIPNPGTLEGCHLSPLWGSMRWSHFKPFFRLEQNHDLLGLSQRFKLKSMKLRHTPNYKVMYGTLHLMTLNVLLWPDLSNFMQRRFACSQNILGFNANTGGFIFKPFHSRSLVENQPNRLSALKDWKRNPHRMWYKIGSF